MCSCGCGNSWSCGGCGGSCCGGSGCGCGGSNGVTTLPSFPSNPVWPGTVAQYPVYVSYPSFFTDGAATARADQALFGSSNSGSSSGCGCGRSF